MEEWSVLKKFDLEVLVLENRLSWQLNMAVRLSFIENGRNGVEIDFDPPLKSANLLTMWEYFRFGKIRFGSSRRSGSRTSGSRFTTVHILQFIIYLLFLFGCATALERIMPDKLEWESVPMMHDKKIQFFETLNN